MVTIEAQKPPCPICHKADKVKKLQTVYNEGMQRFTPPPLPGKTVSMMRSISPIMLIVGICIFLILVLVGSESFGQNFDYAELALVLVTLAFIVTALVLSYLAFTRVVKGDQEASKHYPEWDRAMENWGRLRYCSRDDVVFDPQSGKTLSEEELASLLSTEVEKEKQSSQQSTSLAH
ncbi:MAG TPA: hypothetical protein VK140_16170 [Ktedonobacteraceae bacterium]|nr:hypothetical protein [Ktedonobacteraceae bacterium]